MALAPEDSQLNVETNHPIPGLRRMSITPTSRALRAQRLRKRRSLTTPINEDPEFNDGDAEWDTELTGNATGATDFATPGQVAMTSTVLGGVRLRQLGILVVGLTYRVEIDVSTFGAGPVLLFNGGAELDFNVTGAGTFVVEFIADSADLIIGLKLGLLRAVTCTAVRVLRHG